MFIQIHFSSFEFTLIHCIYSFCLFYCCEFYCNSFKIVIALLNLYFGSFSVLKCILMHFNKIELITLLEGSLKFIWIYVKMLYIFRNRSNSLNFTRIYANSTEFTWVYYNSFGKSSKINYLPIYFCYSLISYTFL